MLNVSRLYLGSCFHLCLQPALVYEKIVEATADSVCKGIARKHISLRCCFGIHQYRPNVVSGAR